MHIEHFNQLTWWGLDWGVFIFSGERGLVRLYCIWLGATAEFSVTTWSSSKLKISSQSSVFLLASLPADGTITFFLNLLFGFSGSPRPNAIPVTENTPFKDVLLLDYFPHFIIFSITYGRTGHCLLSLIWETMLLEKFHAIPIWQPC